jgi:hypothetical protein
MTDETATAHFVAVNGAVARVAVRSACEEVSEPIALR